MILPRCQSLDQLLRVEIRPYRILSKVRRSHELVRLVICVKVVHLCLDLVPIRVLVVDTRSRPVIYAPAGLDTQSLALCVRQHQIVQRVECERRMMETTRLDHLLGCAGQSDDGNAMMFIVVTEEAKNVVLVTDFCPEELLVVIDHVLVVVGPKNDVRKLGWALHFSHRHLEGFE